MRRAGEPEVDSSWLQSLPKTPFRGTIQPAASQIANARGARMAVSFANAARENHTATFTGRSSNHAHKAQNVSPAAARSTCAKELCAKKTGYSAVHAVHAIATRVLLTLSARQ